MKDLSISIVLPVYRQGDHVAAVVEEYDRTLARMRVSYEFILAVNGTGDDSLDACREIAARKPNFRVTYDERGGWGRAVKQGLAAAGGDLLCYTNSARTSARDLMLLIMYGIAHPDTVVKANRKIRDSMVRRFGSLLYNLECRALFDLPFWDINGTPKVFPRSFEKLLALSRDDDLIDLEFNIVCRREGYPMLEVPILAARRRGGASTTNIRSAIRMYTGAYRMWRETRSRSR